MILTNSFDPPLPEGSTATYKWVVSYDYVNEIVPPVSSGASPTYDRNLDLMNNASVPVWWYNGGLKQVRCMATLHLPNDQTATVTSDATVSVYEPTFSNFTPLLNGAWWESPYLNAQMSWNVTLNSKYDGQYGITQLLLGTGFYYGTSGQYVLDGNTEIYGTPDKNGPSTYTASDSTTHTLRFLDNPSAPATPCVDMNIQFKDYLRFQPSGNNSINVATNGEA